MTELNDWTASLEAKEAIISSRHLDPFTVLGCHPLEPANGPQAVVRAFIPSATSVIWQGHDGQASVPMLETDPRGFFEALVPRPQEFRPYWLSVEFANGDVSRFRDCYSFTPVLSEYDLYLFNQGNHYQIYEKLGAHPWFHQGVRGVLFAVWAPSAHRVSLIGELNQWDGRRHQMRQRGSSGVWEIFVPHVGPGLLYKFEVLTSDGSILIKSDPYAFAMEKRPKTAAIVHDLNGYHWTDQEWMLNRTKVNALNRPLAIYEVHLGSWRRKENNRWMTYREIVEELVPYVQDLGFNYIELLPLAEHPFDGSWGYQVTGYYSATSRFGSPQDLMYLVDRCHAAGIGVLLDWVPAHFPRDPHALEFFDGTHLYEHADPRQGKHSDWGTLVFNYGRNEVKNFLVANALFWLDKFHIDGMRVDAVASMLYLDYSRQEGEWVPNQYGGRENLEAMEFIKTFNTKVFEFFPGVMTIAEESTAWPAVTRPVHLGGLGFSFKWNMGWMHDMLQFMSLDPIFRRYHMDYLTFTLMYAYSENYLLALSHDEVVHGKKTLLDKMPGDHWQKFANMRLLLSYMYGEPGKKMLFMGSELGQWWEWDHDQQLQWHLLEEAPHQGLFRFVRDLNRLYRSEPALF